MSIHLNSHISRRLFLSGATAFSFTPVLRSFAAAKEPEGKSETWAFLSDTHIPADPAFVARNKTVPAENLKRVVAEVLAEKDILTGVLIDGDCAYNTGLTEDYDLFAKLIEPLVAAKLPIHITMGNHDDRGPFFEKFAERKSQHPPVENKHVAVVESSVANFVFLDSMRFVNKVEGEFGEQQLRWLSQILEKNADKPTLVIGHHNPQIVEKDAKITGLIDSKPFFDVLAGNKQSKAYIYGHTHAWGVESDDAGFHLVNLPPTAYVFNDTRPNGWVRATVSPSGMKLELCALDKTHPLNGQSKDLNWR